VLPYEIYYTHTVTAAPLWRRALGIFIDGDPWLLRYAVTVVACLTVVIASIAFVNSAKNVVGNAISAIDCTIYFFLHVIFCRLCLIQVNNSKRSSSRI
jgi:hypothetical protein